MGKEENWFREAGLQTIANTTLSGPGSVRKTESSCSYECEHIYHRRNHHVLGGIACRALLEHVMRSMSTLACKTSKSQ